MINFIQPLVNLTNANLQAASRFMQAPEMVEQTKSNLDNYGKLVRQSWTQIAQSDALNLWMRQTRQNFSNFTNECTQSMFGLISQAPNLLAVQMKGFSRQVEQGTSADLRTGEYIDEAAEADNQEEGHLTRNKTRQHRQAG